MSQYETSSTADVEAIYEPPDELTQEEMRRLIEFARDVKAGRKSLMLVQEGVKGTRLWIKAYDKAA